MLKIQTLYAFDLFCNFKFKDSMDIFYKLDIDASHVIGLFTELLPTEFRNQLHYPDKLPSLQGRDMENGYHALVEYLTSVRHKLDGSTAKTICPVPIMDGCVVIKSKRQLQQIIDTSLLKCYLKINDSLVAPLLRLPKNFCHLEETERALKKCGKFSELITFYKTKGFHHKALALLKEQSDVEDSPLFGNAKTVQYLQNLGPEHIDLVCDYAAPVLEKSPDDGLAIFTEDLFEVESWPRGRVLDFLMKQSKPVVIPYLEHIIASWKETSQLFHNALILQYKDLLVRLHDNNNNETMPDAGDNSEDILDDSNTDESSDDADGASQERRFNRTRSKLRELLSSSKSFTADTVLPQFPLHCLHEERALVLGSLGRHREALALYLFQVRNLKEALAYCDIHHRKSNIKHDLSSTSNVYTTLYQLLVSPPDPLALQAMYISHANAHADWKPDIDTALSLLDQHGSKVDLKVVLTATPSSVVLSRLAPYLETAFGDRVSKKHQLQLQRGLMHAEHLAAQEQRIALESQNVTVDEYDVCPVCNKRFRSQSAIVRFPNGKVVHYSCQDRVIVN